MLIYLNGNNPTELKIEFDYSEERVEKIRKVKGRKWDNENKVWIVPCKKETIIKLYDLFEDEGIEIRKSNIVSQLPNKEHIKFLFNFDKMLEMLNKYKEFLILKGYSDHTRKAYLGHIRRFLIYNSYSA